MNDYNDFDNYADDYEEFMRVLAEMAEEEQE